MNWEVWTMKSRTLSCEMTILRKDLTRFAPMWISLGVVLAICAFDQLNSAYPDPREHLPMAVFFAPIFALNLFGYLTDPAECSAVHSLPIRREGLFLIHTAAAFLMYLVPMSVYFIATDPVMDIGILTRLGWSALDFTISFAMALLCVFITGRKIGAGLLYVFFQFLPILIGFYIEFLYLPLLPGVEVDSSILFPGLPSGNIEYFITEVFHDRVEGPVWPTVVMIMAVSLVLFGICLLMYRKRKLEHAGDLLAVRWLDPVFAVCSGLTGSCAICLFFGLGSGFTPFPFGLGLAFGYFSYWMLSKKSARVFTPKLLAGFGALAMALVGSVLVVSMDPLDRVHYQPDVSTVKSAAISQAYSSTDAYETSDPEQIAALQALQLELLENHIEDQTGGSGYNLHLTYRLENGRTIMRAYEIADESLLEQAAWYLSQPSAIFETDDPQVRFVEVRRAGKIVYLPQDLLDEFMEVFLNECRQGRMFRFGWDPVDPSWDLEFSLSDGSSIYLSLKAKAVDTIAWLSAHCTETKTAG